MDDKKTTTRKSFMHKAGLAFAGLFVLSAATKSTSHTAKGKTANELQSNPFNRIRPAQGAVRRKI